MKVVHCIWERQNLNLEVAEVLLSSKDHYSSQELQSLEKDYDYIVVKVPVNMVTVNYELSKLGYYMIETQIGISKKYRDFNFDDKLIKYVYPHFESSIIQSKEELEEVIGLMTPNMFSTDRIYLDPYFDREASMRRYANWMRNEFGKEGICIRKSYYDGTLIGFGMDKRAGDYIHGIVGGIFEKYQNAGYGILTPARRFLVSKKYNEPFRLARSAISSNNPAVLRFYNYLNFTIDNMSYVFVKHTTRK